MLKRLRTAHPILYCILSEVLFLGSMVVFSLLATIVLAAAGADFDTMDGYLFGSVQEAVGLAVALLLLTRTGRLDLLRRRGCGFLNGMLVGMYPLFFIGYTTVGTLAFDRPDTPLLPLPPPQNSPTSPHASPPRARRGWTCRGPRPCTCRRW